MLALSALRAGWMIDDYFHRAILLERSRFRDLLGTPPEMFRFFRGDPERTGRLMDLGLNPWWTYPSLKGEFLQALTVLTHRLDYALWPDSPVLMHAHSLLWLGAAVGLTAAFYRRMFGATWVAGVVGGLGAALGNEGVERVGTVSRVVLPTDGLWRGAMNAFQDPISLVQMGPGEGGFPFLSDAPLSPAYLAWAAVWIAVVLGLTALSFQRRDV
jgi:hypothetical protein